MGGHCRLLFVRVGGSQGRSLSLSCVSKVVVRREEATSHIVTTASRLNFHVRSHVDDLT